MPQAFTILAILIIIMAVLTWIIPAGQYDTVSVGGSEEPVAGTYHTAERSGQGIGAVLLAPFHGLYDAIEISVFILMVGAFLGVMNKTGALEAGVYNILKIMNGKEKLMIPVLMILFALGGTTFGMAEETIAFYTLLLPIFIMAGYDAITAVAVIMTGAGVGVLCSTVNPFATGIASGFAGVSMGDGIVIRLILLFICLAVSICYVMKYASRVRKNPELSYVAELHQEHVKMFSDNSEARPELTARRKTALTIFAATFIIMIYAVIPFGDIGITVLPALNWWFPQLSALFLVMAIITGLIYGLSEKDIIDGIIQGAAEMLGVAFIIGISRGITVIMNDGSITDTILHFGETLLSSAGSAVFVLINYLIFIPLSFLIPSTSGLATLSMPVFAPLADFAAASRSLIITAFQCASGLVNIVTPTSAVVMGGLTIAHVPYEKWIKFIWKYLLILFVLCGVVLIIASKI